MKNQKKPSSLFYIKNLIILCFFGPAITLLAQKTDVLHLKNAQTHEAVPFANITFDKGQKGTVTDINGSFAIPYDIKKISISCLGYQPKELTASNFNNKKNIFINPVDIELSQIDVFPGENPAIPIIRKAVEKKDKNNPEITTPFSCIIYHKMTFGFEIPDTLSPEQEDQKSLWEFSKENDFLLIESVSEKKHLPPDKTNERIISGRVSGFNQPTLSAVPSQLQPFTFYDDYIRLLDVDLLNPVSSQGIRHYLFILEDTIISASGDSIFYISFSPRRNANIPGMKGSLHIHQPTHAIQSVSATTMPGQTLYQLSIRQNYILHNKKYWFPQHLETRLTMNQTAIGQSFPFPMIGEGKSTVTAIDTNPGFDPKEFSNYQLIDESGTPNASSIENLRHQPLTQRDSATYHILDSLGRAHDLDRLLNLQISLINGYLPLGWVNLNIKKLLGYNQYEGIKTGIGIQTSDRISKVISTEGFFTRSLKSEDNNYGGSLTFNFNPVREQKWEIAASKTLHETGSISFLDGIQSMSDERYRGYSVQTVDRSTEFKTSITSRIFNHFKAETKFSYSDITPLIEYPYLLEQGNQLSPPFNSYEAAIRIKWQPKLKLSYTGLGLNAISGEMPSIWFNFIAGRAETNTVNNYFKTETQFEEQIRLSPAITSNIRFTAGHLWGNYTPTHLYSAFGTYSPTIGIESRYTFATMRPNEFAANTFSTLFFRANIPTRVNTTRKFKPEITLSTSAGWGTTSGSSYESINTFDKGYYESGVYFGKLIKQNFIKYGFSVHYRYGPYSLNKEIDNWAFKIGIEIGL